MPLLTKEDLRRHSRLGWASLFALAAAALALWLTGRHGAALGTGGGLLGCLALVLPPRERMPILPWRLRALPRRLDAAPVLGTLVSCPGYGLGWFYLPGPYDEIVHLVNGMLAGAVFAALLQADRRRRGVLQLAVAGAACGLAVGAGWEVFEALTGLIGDWTDTWTDVLLTTLGATFAAALARAFDGRRKPPPHPAAAMPRARWHQP
ncbi:hypothetical protein E0493_16675 [Roseomonas sp. M0104]|uniref:VanZ family protein n=1 Tax=Teichococcus coralli TaxID=2545983 RepID=A0A845BDJ5_9PROT|nr:hypothetical protein [Pseudoroseomonas coralli]MXP64985.1 hypothetical protein [Pseudoroseomonas coralli]